MGKAKNTPANSNYNAQAEEKVNGFARIYSKDVTIGLKNKLTGADFRVWMFLSSCRVFIDDDPNKEPISTKIPTVAEIAAKLQIHERTAKSSLRKLKKLGILADFIEQIRQ